MRARNIKPAFFQNEALSEVSFAARLLFIGLWGVADREGRLEDRPKRIKAQVFPFDDIDIDSHLRDLDKSGFIKRYEIDGLNLIQVVNFTKHQKPHPKEAESVLPPCPYLGTTQTIPRYDPDTTQVQPRYGQDNTKVLSSPADILNPSSLNPDSPTGFCSEPSYEDSEPDISFSPSESSSLPEEEESSPRARVDDPPPCPHEAIIRLYHETLPELPHVRVWGAGQKTHLLGRWREDPARQNLNWWRWYFREVACSDFLMGRTDRPWNGCNLAWLVRPSNLAKVLNGQYQNRGSPGRPHLTEAQKRQENTINARNRLLARIDDEEAKQTEPKDDDSEK